jgi:putative NIF3 family GTP cyclohydrolase 1 type 2
MMNSYTVRSVEQLLFKAFPAADALPGDRNGLTVGDPDACACKLAVALDATEDSIALAAAAGCNVLVTHHGAFWNAPESFLPAGNAACSGGGAVYAAVAAGVALINMHTNLDCAPVAREMLLAPVDYTFTAGLVVSGGGLLGQLGKPVKTAKPATLEQLAQRYEQAFGAVAKVWGDPATMVGCLAACSGAGGEILQNVINSPANCYVTGELRYHETLELAHNGIALIELGHDISELPYRYHLRDALLAAGFLAENIVVLEPTTSWWNV